MEAEKQALDKMSLATCKVLKGDDNRLLEWVISEALLASGSWSVLESLCFFFELDMVSNSIRNRICFSTPTNSSSTLCSIPADTSMNFDEQDLAKVLPSAKELK